MALNPACKHADLSGVVDRQPHVDVTVLDAPLGRPRNSPSGSTTRRAAAQYQHRPRHQTPRGRENTTCPPMPCRWGPKWSQREANELPIPIRGAHASNKRRPTPMLRARRGTTPTSAAARSGRMACSTSKNTSIELVSPPQQRDGTGCTGSVPMWLWITKMFTTGKQHHSSKATQRATTPPGAQAGPSTARASSLSRRPTRHCPIRCANAPSAAPWPPRNAVAAGA